MFYSITFYNNCKTLLLQFFALVYSSFKNHNLASYTLNIFLSFWIVTKNVLFVYILIVKRFYYKFLLYYTFLWSLLNYVHENVPLRIIILPVTPLNPYLKCYQKVWNDFIRFLFFILITFFTKPWLKTSLL